MKCEENRNLRLSGLCWNVEYICSVFLFVRLWTESFILTLESEDQAKVGAAIRHWPAAISAFRCASLLQFQGWHIPNASRFNELRMRGRGTMAILQDTEQ
jgi:hypothetical protein